MYYMDNLSLLAFLISVFLVVFEFKFCLKKRFVTGLLLFFTFNLVFLHAWIPIELWLESFKYVHDYVHLSIFIFDLSLLFVYVVFFKKEVQCVGHFKNDGWYWGALILIFVSFGAVSLLFFDKGMPIFSDDIESARYAFRKGSGYLMIFLTIALPLSIAFVYVTGIACNKKLLKNSGYLLIILLFLLMMATGFRAFSMFLVITLLFMHFDTLRNFTKKHLLYGVLVIGSFFVFVTYLKVNQGHWEDNSVFNSLLYAIRHRVLMEIPWVIQHNHEYVASNGYAYGSTYWMDIVSAMPGPGSSYGDELMKFVNPNPQSIVVPLTPSLIGESYVNFGYFGVVLFGAMMTGLIMYLDRFVKYKKISGLIIVNTFRVILSNSITLGIGTLLVSRIIPVLIFVFFIFGWVLLLRSLNPYRFRSGNFYLS